MSNQPIPGDKNIIPEKQAIEITTNYRNYIAGIDPKLNYPRAFLIPMEDITQLAQFQNCPNVRAYLTMDVPGDVSTIKVILVPVNEQNQDVLSISVPGAPDDAAVTDQSTIYDFSSPCPQACDIDSPLFS